MRKLTVDHSETDDRATSDVLLTPQPHTTNDPLFPRLKIFRCLKPVAGFIPFIPLFLSPNTVNITIHFVTSPSIPAVMVASIIRRLPTLCPNLEFIKLGPLPRDSVITKAVSEMLLGCNKAILKYFLVDSSLVGGGACRVLYCHFQISLCSTSNTTTLTGYEGSEERRSRNWSRLSSTLNPSKLVTFSGRSKILRSPPPLRLCSQGWNFTLHGRGIQITTLSSDSRN